MLETPDRTESLFAAAIALANAPERVALLDRECAGDQALRGRVEALLRAHDRAGHLLDRPVPGSPVETAGYIPGEQPGTIIAGRYKLLEAIGEGGMGTVWVAEQTQPVRRKVALKLIKAGMDSKSVLARFEAERQALAVMDHPNIAKVLDGGLTETGRPFFVMEYVKGVPITEYCDATRLSVPERLNLFGQVCAAVQHAHQKGIIHRDLKPSNILVAPYDDKPVPKVIDFGLAKAMHQSLTERTLHTAHETVLGTPLYMSPEQAQLNNLDVDTRSDIYSLGVLLYELLTGTTPLEKRRFKEAAWDEIKRIIREEEAPRPSMRLSSSQALPSLAASRHTEPARLTKLVRGELDWIVMKALDKDRTRRYSTASEFAADITRHLSDEPVLAGPPRVTYRMGKFLRKHRSAVTVSVMFVLALLVGLGTSLALYLQAVEAWQATDQARSDEKQKTIELGAALMDAEAKKKLAEALAQSEEKEKNEAVLARKQAEKNEAIAEWRLYASHIAAAQRAWETHDPQLVVYYLNACRKELRGWEHAYLSSMVNNKERQSFPGVLAWTDGKKLITATGVIGWWDPGSKKLITHSDSYWADVFYQSQGIVDSNAMTPAMRHRYFAQRAHDLVLPSDEWLNDKNQTFTLFDLDNGKIIRTFQCPNFQKSPWSWSFSRDGSKSVSCREKTMTVWDTESRREIVSIKNPRNTDFFLWADLSPDGKLVLAACAVETGPGSAPRPRLQLWDAASGQELHVLKAQPDPNDINVFLVRAAFSPDGKKIARGTAQNTVKLWDVASGQEILTGKGGHQKLVSCLAFSPGGGALVSASADGTLKVWNAGNGAELFTIRCGHVAGSVCFSPDGSQIAAGSLEGKFLNVWDARSGHEVVTLKLDSPDWIGRVAFNSAGTKLISSGRNEVKVWYPLQSHERTLLSRVPTPWVAFTPDHKKVVTASNLPFVQGELLVWDNESGERRHDFAVQFSIFPGTVAFSPDGNKLVCGVALGEPGGGVPGGLAPLRPGGLNVWDLRDDKRSFRLKGHETDISCTAFSPDGKKIISGSTGSGPGNDDTLKLWDAQSGRHILSFKGQQGQITALAFSPDGKKLISAAGPVPLHAGVEGMMMFLPGDPVMAKLWDVGSGRELLTLQGKHGPISNFAFSSDGKKILGCESNEPTIHMWDANTGAKLMSFEGHLRPVTSVAFNPDASRIVSGSADKTVKVWETQFGMETLTLRGYTSEVTRVAFSPDGTQVISSDRSGTLKFWDASSKHP